ncbi:hypothetical protein BKA67DRAFT_563530 [Truncatella angustata]|uniref:RNase MRP protein 1 RNA binding domain-containing protein n=1 Tax=Truncatella angustata TaxID=152316 RepID=A0A9P8ZXA4_9PEZI|nr:uncharacterized protein BKA67DRAFT_563530 [Truncatella angustata]KAH6653898.1 hypothetical protein BKA67DRAFT_563530 [Truncatella angustata]KAH8198110.1 hypothetical protein TruAng_007731 [Truncatella angustata]
MGDSTKVQAPSASSYQSALAKVQPLVPILAGFNHRNRSQHRHARWWAAFGSLRRNVGRLVSELEAAAAKRDARNPSKKRGRGGQEGGGGNGGKAVEDKARWMRDFLVGEAYLDFSQLAADNQFAVLGIVLLGVLASVHDACIQLVGEASSLVEVALDELSTAIAEPAVVVEVVQKDMAKKPSVKRAGLAENDVDFGQVVSREEVAAAATAAQTPKIREADGEPSVKRKKKDVGKSTNKPIEEVASREEVPKKDKAAKEKKKKKKSQGDEFDDLFSSLV